VPRRPDDPICSPIHPIRPKTGECPGTARHAPQHFLWDRGGVWIYRLAGYLLARRLADRLISSAPARIVQVASISQQPLDPADLFTERHYDGVTAYRRSRSGGRSGALKSGNGPARASPKPGGAVAFASRALPSRCRFPGASPSPAPWSCPQGVNSCGGRGAPMMIGCTWSGPVTSPSLLPGATARRYAGTRYRLGYHHQHRRLGCVVRGLRHHGYSC
jgi:hypothetical protein